MRKHGFPNFPDPNGQGVISGLASDGIDPRSPQFQAANKTCAKYAGGGSPSATQQAQASTKALEYSECMRAHGVSNYPDPNSQGAISLNSSSGIDPNAPVFKAAQKTCQPILGAVTLTSGGAP